MGVTTIGFIGSGHIGSTVAQLAVTAGYDVVLSNSRGPETLSELVDRLGPHARAATPAEAAAAGDLVVLTVPLKAYRDIPAEPLQGTVVIDTCNYYPGRDGRFPALDDGSATSSELVQQHLAGAHVVKGFNNIYFEHLATLGRPSGDPERTALPIAGDDAGAKQAVTAFLDAIGYDAVDAGSLADSWRFQPDTPAYGHVYVAPGSSFPGGAAHPGSADRVRAALAEAQR